jgi:PAS domain S-box-containing protein
LKKAFIVAILLLLFSFLATSYFIELKTDTYKHNELLKISEIRKQEIQRLIKQKSLSTLSLGIALSKNPNIIDALLKHDPSKLRLKELSDELNRLTNQRTIWFHIVTDKGISLYKSWVNKKYESVLSIRPDLVQALKERTITETISVGKFSMTFKSIVPIFSQGRFLGVLEVISHLDSIADYLTFENIDSMIFADKRYKKQLSAPYTDIFVGDYYLVNLNHPKEILKSLTKKKLENYISKPTYSIDGDKLVISKEIENSSGEGIGYYVLFQDLQSIEFDKLDDFIAFIKFSHIFIIIAIILGMVVYYLSRRKRESEKESAKLQKLVDKEVAQRLKSSRLFDKIINSTTNTVVLLDREFRFSIVNSAFKAMHGKKDDEILGKTPPEAKIMPNEFFTKKIEPRLKQVLQNEKISFKTNIKRKNREISLIVQMSPFSTESGIEGIIIVTTDITKEMQLQEENLQIQKKAALGDLISIIAHQLKQPLNSIKMAKEVVTDEFEFEELTKESVERFSERIDKNIQFMLHSIDDLRNFFRPDKAPKSFSVVEAIEKSLEIVGTHISSKGIDIKKEFVYDANVDGIESEFEQVIINLLTNGKDILLERNISDGYLKIKTHKEDECVVISIEDNGGGVPEDIIDRVFDSYFTTKGEQGTGIGLNLSKMIIEGSMGGTISVANSNEGALFEIKLKTL